MGVKQDLLKLGMVEEDFSEHGSDLYVRKTGIVEKYLSAYEFKGNVTEFIDNISGERWYDFPFALTK